MSDMPDVYIPNVIWMSSKTGGNYLVVDVVPDRFKEEPEAYGKPLPYISVEALEKKIKNVRDSSMARALCDLALDIHDYEKRIEILNMTLTLLREMAGEK